MAVKIRLARRGRKKKPFYHIVVADARAPRDGKFIEKIGSYNPLTSPATIDLDREKAFDWLGKGAQPTETVRSILRFKGVLFKKHLQRGVKKGAFEQEIADQKLTEWIDAKESRVQARVEKNKDDRRNYNERLAGLGAHAPAPKAAAEEEIQAFRESSGEEE
jgi:small subunit ribosomal protein S16